MDGWISLYRQIMDLPEYFESPFDRIRCWIDLLFLAERKQREFRIRGQLVTVDVGDIAVSVDTLRKRWGFGSNRTVISRLKEFESDERITIEHNKLVNIIKIVNYTKYQCLLGIRGDFKAKTAQQTAQQTAQPIDNIDNKENISSLRSDISKKPTKKTQFDFFEEIDIPAEYRETFYVWLKFRSELKKPFKTKRGVEGCYKELLKLSGDSPELARKIVEQSIANEWQGLFELKQNNNSNEKNITRVQDKRRSYEVGNIEKTDYSGTF